jgi:hypothetical protein
MTATRNELRKTPDPTLSTTGADEGRQFLGEASGRVVLTPKADGAPALRVPVHSNAKPSSSLYVQSPNAGSDLALVGRGVANGPLGAESSYVSLASAFEQLGSSPTMPKCTTAARADCYKSELERSVDLDRVGVTSDVAASPTDPYLYFGVSAKGKFTSAETAVNYGVYVDVTGDGAWDYQVTTYRIPDFDAPLVVVTDRQYQLQPAEDPYVGFMNVVDGTVDTNAFDSDVQILSAPLSAMPLFQPATSRISFGVQSSSAYGTVDNVGTTSTETGTELAPKSMSFDPLHPGLSFAQSGQPAILVPASGGTRFTITQDPASYAKDASVGQALKGAMVVLSQNSSSVGRTQSVPVAVKATRH